MHKVTLAPGPARFGLAALPKSGWGQLSSGIGARAFIIIHHILGGYIMVRVGAAAVGVWLGLDTLLCNYGKRGRGGEGRRGGCELVWVRSVCLDRMGAWNALLGRDCAVRKCA